MAETTNSLLKNIVNGKDFPKILETNKDAFEELAVSEYLRRLCEERGYCSGAGNQEGTD